MEQQLISNSEFKYILREIVAERISELVHEMQVFEYVLRDRGLWRWEQLRYKTIGDVLETNENIMKSIDPDFTSIQ